MKTLFGVLSVALLFANSAGASAMSAQLLFSEDTTLSRFPLQVSDISCGIEKVYTDLEVERVSAAIPESAQKLGTLNLDIFRVAARQQALSFGKATRLFQPGDDRSGACSVIADLKEAFPRNEIPGAVLAEKISVFGQPGTGANGIHGCLIVAIEAEARIKNIFSAASPHRDLELVAGTNIFKLNSTVFAGRDCRDISREEVKKLLTGIVL